MHGFGSEDEVANGDNKHFNESDSAHRGSSEPSASDHEVAAPATVNMPVRGAFTTIRASGVHGEGRPERARPQGASLAIGAAWADGRMP